MKLIDHPDNPVPEGARAGFVETPDGVRIRYAHWPASGRERRGTVTLVQGRAEFIEKYFEVIEDLRRRGFAVVTFDWRGQGGSQRLTRNPKRGHISNFRKYRLDLRTVLKEISLANYPGPHFCPGPLDRRSGAPIRQPKAQDDAGPGGDHLAAARPAFGRMGAEPCRFRPQVPAESHFRPARAAAAESRRAQDLSASRKTSAFPPPASFRCSAWAGFFIPGGNAEIFIPFETNRQTSDRIRFDRFNKVLKQAPELGVGAPTIGWLNAAARTMLALRRRDAGPNMKLPCLVLAAGNDRIVSTPETEDFVSRTKAAAYVEIPGAAHELMMERDIFRDQFWAAFDAFVPGAEAEQELERARI
ncbi:alpha/beta hydrolase [Roseibium salinum]|nr:alpha/beta hydrolase [Roseibium salinum]